MRSKIISLLIAVALLGCNKDDDTPTVPIVQDGAPHFSVTFDSQTFEATAYAAIIAQDQIAINASRGANQESFNISISATGIGTYAAKDNPVSYSAGVGAAELFVSVNPDDHSQDTGQVIITAINTATKTVSGTFSCTGYYRNNADVVISKPFTAGSFTMPYTTE